MMSENKDNEIHGVTDSQETFYDKSQNMDASQSFNESQDFALVVGDDSDESTKVEPEVDEEAANRFDEKNVVEAEIGETDNETKKDDDLGTENNVVEKSKAKKDGDDEDIIQGTPPEASSPSRKLLSGKRRGESLDEPAAKIQRTVSQRDALKLGKEKSLRDSKLFVSKKSEGDRETQSDIVCDNTEAIDQEVSDVCATQSSPKKKIVIEETQDLEDSEAIPLDDAGTEGDDKPSEKEKTSVEEANVTIKPTSSDGDNGTSVDKEVKSDPQPTEEAVTNGQGGENTAENVAMDVEGTQVAESEKDKFSNVPLPSSDSAPDSNCEGGSMNSNKSRQSIEVIYDRKSSSQEKKRVVPLVEIGEEGDEIILEVSTESVTHSTQNTTVYKSCTENKTTSDSSYKSAGWNNAACPQNDTSETSDCQITNGDEELPNSGTTKTVSVGSDLLDSDALPDTTKSGTTRSVSNDSDVYERFKLSDTLELCNAVIDSEGDSLIVNENKFEDKADSSINTLTSKSTPFEKKTNFYIELKYLLHVDDNTKEIVSKELTTVQCEQLGETSNAQKSSDTSGCLADISGNANKELSPGSVVSNPQLFQLGPSRFSIASTISSTSSVSSAASLAVKLYKDVHFPQPKGRAKQARRPLGEAIEEEKLNVSENFEKAALGWKNAHLITESVLQFLNTIVHSPDIFHQDTEPGKGQDKVLSSTPEPDTTENKVLSSTPEPRSGPQDEKVISQTATPKGTKNKKPLKRSRAKSNSTPRNNGTRKASPEIVSTSQEDRLPIIKKKRESVETVKSNKPAKQTTPNVSTPSRLRPETPRLEALRSLTPQNLEEDELVGKVVFARWSDKQYYPGKVAEKSRGKYRVNFFDGKSKLLIEEFVIPIPDVLREGLSVYATSKDDDYGSMGIILRSEEADGKVYYTIDVDQGNQIRVQIEDIFLMPDQAQILKEEIEIDSKSLPKTPQHLGLVSLDNLVDGKRRPRQAVTPTVSTPKSRKRPLSKASKLSLTDSVPASGSGVPKVEGKALEISSSESEALTSDSNAWSTEDVDGVHPELGTIPGAISKGTKGKGQTRSKPTQDDDILGPIPPASSNIFKNMSFILTSTSSDHFPRHHTDDSGSELGTENEEEWLQIPFIKERVKRQLISGGGTVYDSFKLIPQNEYKNTKLITNVPNLTAKSVQCFSVGIPVYTHRWVIQCCKDNKCLLPAPYALPVGWSLEKKAYVEACERTNKKPFSGMMIGIPLVDDSNQPNRSIQFWRSICQNAGAEVQIINDAETDVINCTAILTDNRCPSLLVDKAENLQIPLVSTIWIVQCIIVGQLLTHDSQPEYKHTHIQS